MSSSQLFCSDGTHYRDECLGFHPGLTGGYYTPLNIVYSLDPIDGLPRYLAQVQDGEHVLRVSWNWETVGKVSAKRGMTTEHTI